MLRESQTDKDLNDKQPIEVKKIIDFREHSILDNSEMFKDSRGFVFYKCKEKQNLSFRKKVGSNLSTKN